MINFNPVLSEIDRLSPEAQGALGMAGHAIAQSAATPPPNMAPAPPVIPQDAPPMAPMRMPGSDPIPSLGAPPMPDVIGPRGTTTGDEAYRGKLLNEGPAIPQIAHRIEGTGFGQNHPILGKILGHAAQGAARLGNIALDAASTFVAPGISHIIPGTDEYHDTQLADANAAVTQDVTNRQKESEGEYQKAEARKTEGETANQPQQFGDAHALTESSINEHNAQASALLHPQAKTDFEAWALQNPGKPIEDWLKAQSDAKPHGAEHINITGPNGKPMVASYDPITRQTTGPDGQIIPNPVPYEKAAVSVNNGEKNLWGIPQPDGTHTVVSIKAGDSIPSNAVSLSGLSSEQVPTAATRTMKETAPKVIGLVDRVNQLLDANEKQLGPLDSRWNEFTAGKIGVPNQGYTQLRTDVGLLTTALMRMHVGARGGEKIMEHFQDLIDSSKQSPTNLRAALGEIKSYANTVSTEGGESGGGSTWKAPTDAPAAPAQDGKVLKDATGNVIAKSKGGAWVQP